MPWIEDDWKEVIGSEIKFDVMTKVLPTKGNLVYEYNPFRNYRLSKNMYEYKNNIFSLDLLKINYGILILYSYNNKTYLDLDKIKEEYPNLTNSDLSKIKTTSEWVNLPDLEEPILKEVGELVDFITDELTFSLEHPVNLLPLYSYDGSVNLVINDGLNIPRMINSRFSATGKNTYEIIDRKGNNDTNIYDLGTQFDIDTSLYKRIVNIPKIDFRGVNAGGNLKVGNYHFYFKLADADGNETDFVGESGLVSIFIGFNNPNSIHSGTKNENSFKTVSFLLSNIDSAYDNVYVYYSRYTAELGFNSVTEYAKIEKKFKVNNSGFCNILITGFEETKTLTDSDINLNYNVVDCAYTQAACQNMLFMANVHKPDIPYKELADLSLRFLPYLKEDTYDLVLTEEYVPQSSSLGYYDPKYIYNKVGYWNKEIYRLGIVYILPNNELSPVFNIRGGNHIKEYESLKNDEGKVNFYTDIPLYKTNTNGTEERVYINYNEETYSILQSNDYNLANSGLTLENIKGVIRFESDSDSNTVFGLDIRVSDEVIQELKKYVKGYFFVRQTRIPTILALGVTIGIDNESRTPTLPTRNGIIDSIKDLELDKTYIEADDIDGVNYISEGFLTRYRFKLKAKGSFLKVLSTVMSYAATVASFVPALQGVGLALNAASFITSTIATGKFQVASFVSTALSAVPAIGKGLTKAALWASKSSLIKGIDTATGVLKEVSKAGEILSGVQTVVEAGKAVSTVTKIILVSNVAQSAYNTYKTSQLLISVTKGASYNGRYTEVPSGYEKKELDESRTLSEDFIDRFILKNPKVNTVLGIICPDYELNLSYYNLIFTGGEHTIRYTKALGINYYNYLTNVSVSNYFTSQDRHFFFNSYFDTNTNIAYTSKIIGVPDNVKCVGLDNYIFRSRAGEAEEAWRYEFAGKEYDDNTNILNNSDIVRGSFGPYLACTTTKLDPAMLVDIMIPLYSDANMEEYFQIRMDDSSVFNAISERIDIHKDQDDYLVNKNKSIGTNIKELGYTYNLYRGDCYICLFTHRINRNFNDPNAPYNDLIVDLNTWKDNYDPDNTEKYEQINLGDINAVPLGMWLTFKLRSSSNLNIRTLDGSFVDESAMTGHPRGFYPYNPMSTEGTFKHPESLIYNKGFNKSLSERWNFELPDVPYIKNWFGTRIMYSDIHINDAYKNGYRVFQGTHYRDYTREYGEIVKLVPFESSLLCVFEHGVALMPVNERAVAGEGAGGNVYINTSNVLPENPRIISDMFGSQWPESVLKVPGRTGDSPLYVYGVDTVAKKIWRTDGSTLTCISDFKVQEFLNNNITLGERELTPKIGIRNVKTHYNAFKRDVMFTFYDNTYGFEEKVWNLCWNELLLKFITFYSWVPSYMENINNIPFSFDRNTSKWMAKLGTSHTDNSFADGITLTNVVIGNTIYNYEIPVTYINENGEEKTIYYKGNGNNFIGGLSLSNRVLPDALVFYLIHYSLERDSYLNYKMFEIKLIGNLKLPSDAMYPGLEVPVYGLFFKQGYGVNDLVSELYYRNTAKHVYADLESNKSNYLELGGITSVINLKLPIFKDKTGKRPTLPRELMLNPDKLVTLLNIKASIQILDFDESVNLHDDYYNLKAGFESGTTLIDAGYYESVVAITPQWNLLFLSTDFWKHGQAGIIDITDDIYPTYWYGKLHPFEFECVVVNDPSVHKIFTNLELVANKAKPESFHYEVIGETYDFAKDKVNMYFRQEARKAIWLYNGADICYNRNFLKTLPNQLAKSADLPHKYYSRQDTINDIEDHYLSFTCPLGTKHDYKHLSGSEIVYYPTRQEYRVWNHSLAVNLNDLNLDDARSIIAANCLYLEDRWKITINPILICYKNEGKSWKDQSSWTDPNRPPIPVMNSPIPDLIYESIVDGEIEIPDILTDLGYTSADIDTSNWLRDVNIYGYNFGGDLNRKEVDVRDKFMKVRIRYSGEELAIIDFLNTIYLVSYS